MWKQFPVYCSACLDLAPHLLRLHKPNGYGLSWSSYFVWWLLYQRNDTRPFNSLYSAISYTAKVSFGTALYSTFPL